MSKSAIQSFNEISIVLKTALFDVLSSAIADFDHRHNITNVKKQVADVGDATGMAMLATKELGKLLSDDTPIVNAFQKYVRKTINPELVVSTDPKDARDSAAYYHPFNKKLFFNKTHYSFTVPYLVKLRNVLINYYRTGDLDSDGIEYGDGFSALITVIVHELQHAEQGLNKNVTFGNRSKVDSKEIYASGSITQKWNPKTHKYSLHFLKNTELHAMAQEALAQELLKYGWANGTDHSIDRKKSLFETPLFLTNETIKTFKANYSNIISAHDNNIFSVNDSDIVKAGGMKKLYKYIAIAVNDWWYDKSKLLTDDLEQYFIAHSSGVQKRIQKKSTRISRMALSTITKETPDDSIDYDSVYNEYVANPITEVSSDFMTSTYIIRTIEDRHAIVLKMVKDVLAKQISIPFNVVPAMDGDTKFELPDVKIDLNKYIKEFEKLSVGKYRIWQYEKDNIMNPASIMTIQLVNTPDIFNRVFKHYTEILLSRIGMSKVLQSRIKNAGLEFSGDELRKLFSSVPSSATPTQCIKYYTDILFAEISKRCRQNFRWTYDANAANNEVIIPSPYNEILYNQAVVNSFNPTISGRRFFDYFGDIPSFDKLSNDIKTNQSIFYPIINSILTDLNSTLVKKEITKDTIMLNGKQLSSLKKILKSVGLRSIAAMASQEEIRETLKNMKQSYKDMILMNSDVSEKYKNILSAFMS